MEKRCKLKSKSDQKVKIILALLVAGTVLGFAYFSFFVRNEKEYIVVAPLPFTGTYDLSDIENKLKTVDNFVALSEEESRIYFEVIYPNSEESKNRNIFTGAAR